MQKLSYRLNKVCSYLLIILSFYLTALCSLGAQSDNQIFESISTEHGLSSNKVEAVIQDRDGFYWIATQNGLNRFDGSVFKIYRHDPGDSTSLSHNYCTSLVEDRAGDIWVATYKGISRFNKARGTFQRVYFHLPSRNFETTNRIYNLAIDDDGNIWISGRALWKYDWTNESLIHFKNDPGNPSSIPEHTIIKNIIADKANQGIWFTTENELVFYSMAKDQFHYQDNNPDQWKVFNVADNHELAIDSSSRLWFRDKAVQALSYFAPDRNTVSRTSVNITQGVKQLSADDKNRIWIFFWTSDALVFDPASSTISKAVSLQSNRPALSGQGTNLFIDNQKNYWITSGNGISILNEKNQYYRSFILNYDSDQSSIPLKITAISQTSKDFIWIGTNQGLFRFDLSSGNPQYIPVHTGDVLAVTTLQSDSEKLWLGIHDDVMCYDVVNGMVTNKIAIGHGVFFIRKGSDNDLWIGLWSGGLCRLDLRNNELKWFTRSEDGNSIKSNNLITGTLDGQDLWIGYNAGIGFSKYFLPTGIWEHFHPQQNDLSNSNAGTITVITHGWNNDLWLGTHGSGVYRFDPVTNEFENFDQFKGLNSNYVNSILPDENGNLWISTADGMNFLNVRKRSIHTPDMGLVFSDNDFIANGFKGLNGKLYFFAGNQFVEVDPPAYTVQTTSPRLVISSFKIFDREVGLPAEGKTLHLSHRENFFSFQFSLIRTHPGKKVDYAYILEGFDNEWNEAGHREFASYTNVPHGNYQFMVKAKTEEGEWSDPLVKIPIRIIPPFWKTWWFIFISAAVMIAVVYGIYQYQIQQVKKIYTMRAKISRDLHDDIGASLSSIHFNSSIAEQQIKSNPEKAREILQQINRNTRQVIENVSDIVWANYSGQKDKYSLAGRIKNHGHDLLSQKNIDCHYAIDTLAEKKLSNPEARRNILLIIKEAMNNIAKYSEADQAEILVSVRGDHLEISISDNGKGFDPHSSSQGNGLNNMRKRTESIRGHFEIESSEVRGTRIHCRIPLPNISDV